MTAPTAAELKILGCEVVGLDLDDDKIKRAVRPLLVKLEQQRTVLDTLRVEVARATVEAAHWHGVVVDIARAAGMPANDPEQVVAPEVICKVRALYAKNLP